MFATATTKSSRCCFRAPQGCCDQSGDDQQRESLGGRAAFGGTPAALEGRLASMIGGAGTLSPRRSRWLPNSPPDISPGLTILVSCCRKRVGEKCSFASVLPLMQRVIRERFRSLPQHPEFWGLIGWRRLRFRRHWNWRLGLRHGRVW